MFAQYYSSISDPDYCDDDFITSAIPNLSDKLKTCDTISCMIRDALIVNPYEKYDEIQSFIIISKNNEGFYLFVPHYFNLKDSYVLEQNKSKRLQIDKKYIGENIVYIQNRMVGSIISIYEGLTCSVCKEVCPWAEANQPDGNTFHCYNCRSNPYR